MYVNGDRVRDARKQETDLKLALGMNRNPTGLASLPLLAETPDRLLKKGPVFAKQPLHPYLAVCTRSWERERCALPVVRLLSTLVICWQVEELVAQENATHLRVRIQSSGVR